MFGAAAQRSITFLTLPSIWFTSMGGLDWTRKYPAIASLPARQAYPRCFNSLNAPRGRFAVDSPLEGDGFELTVPRQ